MAPPNLVYILADDMGYGDVAALNPECKIPTPHLDAMAARGMRFTDAHASSAVCTPSRYSILTGRYNWRSSMKEGVLWSYDKALIEPGRMTVASYLRDRGYATACIGKWHLGWDWATSDPEKGDVDYSAPIANGPTTHGFDYFYGIVASLDIPPYVYVENDRPTAVPDHVCEDIGPGKGLRRAGPTAPDFDHADCLPNFTRRARKYIAEQADSDKPFFLYFPLPAPHTPILPSPEFQGKSGTNEYGDFCMMVDDVVGQIREELEAHGLAEDTILVFTSDNGCSPMVDFDELADVGHRPSYVFRGHKADIYEGGHRIPLLVDWPARIAGNAECGETVCLSDLLATMADIHGVPLPDCAGEDSVSNLALWDGAPRQSPGLREATVHHSCNGSFSIRQGRWKLELCPGSGGWSFPRPGTDEVVGLPPVQLYDLDADVSETTNVQADHPEIVERLTALMASYVRNGRSTPGEPQENTGPKYWPQLKWMLEGGWRIADGRWRCEPGIRRRRQGICGILPDSILTPYGATHEDFDHRRGRLYRQQPGSLLPRAGRGSRRARQFRDRQTGEPHGGPRPDHAHRGRPAEHR